MMGGLLTYFIIKKLFVCAVAALLQCVVHTLVLKFCSGMWAVLSLAHIKESQTAVGSSSSYLNGTFPVPVQVLVPMCY